MAREKTVVVVDDDDAVRDSLRTLLELRYGAVECYATGAEFLARTAGRSIGCLVLDINMPGLSGFDVLEALVARKQQVPTIIITARSDGAMRQRAHEIGVHAFLDKPVEPKSLMAAINRALAPT